MYTHTYIHVHIHTYIRTYIYIYTYIHTYIHTHTHKTRHRHTYPQVHTRIRIYKDKMQACAYILVYSSASMSKKTRLRVFENIMTRKKLGSRRREVTGTKGIYTVGRTSICSLHQILLGSSIRRMKRTDHVTVMGENRNAFWVWRRNLKKRDNLEEIVLKGDVTTMDLT